MKCDAEICDQEEYCGRHYLTIKSDTGNVRQAVFGYVDFLLLLSPTIVLCWLIFYRSAFPPSLPTFMVGVFPREGKNCSFHVYLVYNKYATGSKRTLPTREPHEKR